MFERLIGVVGRPSFAIGLTVLLTLWIAFNLYRHLHGGTPFDPPPFQWLQVVISALALYLTVLILITQRREYRLEERRAQFTLELAIVAEQKNAKIIEMLEHLRRDHPEIADRIDEEAAAMSTPSNPEAVLEALTTTHDQIESGT